MEVEIILPKFGWTMEEATLVEWLKELGEQVTTGEPLFVVETDKANQEVEAPASGELRAIHIEAGNTVSVGTVIGLIAVSESAVSEPATPPTPLAQSSATTLRPIEHIPLTGMRAVIAERMTTSLREAAQFTLMTEADLTETAARLDSKISPTAVVVQAVARTLKEHPRLNSTLVNGEIQIWDSYRIGVAVALPHDGLVVPIISDAESKDVAELSVEIAKLAEKAHNNQLSADELAGGTFTVTNLGMYGVDAFTPILDPPQTTILGVGRWIEKPAVVNGQVMVRMMTTLSLTVDHRAIDGAPAAAFLRDVAGRLAQGDFS